MSPIYTGLNEFLTNYKDLFPNLGTEKTVRLEVFFKKSDHSSFHYNIHSFGTSNKVDIVKDRQSIDELYQSYSSYDRDIAQWIDAGGIDSFYSCDFDGIIASPIELENYHVNLKINELSSKDRFEFQRKGSIGKGSYSGRFKLEICLDLPETKELISIIQGENHIIKHKFYGDDNFTTRVLFDIYRFSGPKSDQFEICSIYI